MKKKNSNITDSNYQDIADAAACLTERAVANSARSRRLAEEIEQKINDANRVFDRGRRLVPK